MGEIENLERIGAGNETRTRDPNLGKVVLYQLSYSRATELRILLGPLPLSRKCPPTFESYSPAPGFKLGQAACK